MGRPRVTAVLGKILGLGGWPLIIWEATTKFQIKAYKCLLEQKIETFEKIGGCARFGVACAPLTPT